MSPRRVLVGALCAAAVIGVLGLRAVGSPGRGLPSSSGIPARLAHLRGWALWVDPGTPAARAAAALAAAGDPVAADIARLAAEPTATWLASPGLAAVARVRTVARRAAAAGRLPVFVSYEIPDRDCAGYSAGGAPSADAYLRYVGALDGALGARPAAIIVEPDAIASTVRGCLRGTPARDRLALIARAVAVLTRPGRRFVYLDAGNPRWMTDLPALARALRAAGVLRASGFALNVASFSGTRATLSYGRRLSRLLGGAHFVIDTSRNGNGPDTDPADAPTWCNPPGRRLGHAPTTRTGDPLLDAYLWVKPPGDSDGPCRAGAPPAGQWSLDYALALLGGGPAGE